MLAAGWRARAGCNRLGLRSSSAVLQLLLFRRAHCMIGDAQNMSLMLSFRNTKQMVASFARCVVITAAVRSADVPS
jgi:hypothetical protein